MPSHPRALVLSLEALLAAVWRATLALPSASLRSGVAWAGSLAWPGTGLALAFGIAAYALPGQLLGAELLRAMAPALLVRELLPLALGGLALWAAWRSPEDGGAVGSLILWVLGSAALLLGFLVAQLLLVGEGPLAAFENLSRTLVPADLAFGASKALVLGAGGELLRQIPSKPHGAALIALGMLLISAAAAAPFLLQPPVPL